MRAKFDPERDGRKDLPKEGKLQNRPSLLYGFLYFVP
jgi:hypothetical protein